MAVRPGASTSAYLTGNLSGCRVTERSSICVTLRDAVLPTGGTGTADTKSAGASYSYHLTEHSRLSLSGTYTHNSTSDALALTPYVTATSYVTTSASYDRTLTKRLHLTASTHFSKVMGGGNDHTEDVGGSLGISVRFGEY